jgi:2-aminoethylphosphonate-pyruvate transaminase
MKLFTPGPLSTSQETREAMLVDWASRDAGFERLTLSVMEQLKDIYRFSQTTECVLLQGPSSYAIEATIRTLVRKNERVLCLSNGVYGDRIYKIAQQSGYDASLAVLPYHQAITEASIATLEIDVGRYDFLTCVHCETSTGVLNDFDAICAFAARNRLRVIADAVSTFGALDLGGQNESVTAVVGSANKCLEGVPGVAFVFVDRNQLVRAEKNSDSVSFDLHSQWSYMNENRQWRFTPPTQVVSALNSALEQYHSEGGRSRRLARYESNYQTLIVEMDALGLQPLVERAVQSPIIVSYLLNENCRQFSEIYRDLKQRGQIIYPGAIKNLNYLRIGCIGRIEPDDVRFLAACLKDTLSLTHRN